MTIFGDEPIGIGVEANEAEARAEARRIGQVIVDSLQPVFDDFGKQIGRTLARDISRFTANTGFEEVRGQVGRAVREVQDFSRETNELEKDLTALAKRGEAFRRSLAIGGAATDTLAVYDRELRKILRLQEQLQREGEKFTRNPQALRDIQDRARIAQTAIQQEIQAIKASERARIDAEQRAARQLQAEQTRAARERISIRQFERSRMVVETQKETTLTNALIRTSSAEALADQRRTARVRIELLRFTLRQARVIEQAIGSLFRSSAAIISGAYARIERTVFRIGNAFRRSNNDINDGLRGALATRERTIERSFARQTASVQASTARQERILRSFETRASTGIAGLATGRSGLGALLGGGLTFGGGFLLARQLREGFEETVNLNEALNATREIFGSAADDVIAFSENSVEALFVTQSEALKAAQNFGTFGKSAGLAGKDLSQFSNDLTLLATDLASFRNTTVEDATTAISAALRGESEPIRRYGVLLDVATLQQRAFSEGITDTIRKLTPQERVLAATAEIYAQTADAQDDAARTANDFANSSRRAGAALTTAFAAAVSSLIPVAEVITNAAFPALQSLTRFIEGDVGPGLKILRDGLIGATAALAGLVAAKASIEVIQLLGVALRGVATPLGLFVTSVAIVGAAIAVFSRRSETFSAGVEQIVGSLRDLGGRALGRAINALERLADIVAGPIISALEVAVGFVVTVLVPAFSALGAAISNNVLPPLVRLGGVLAAAVFTGLRTVGALLVDVVVPAVVRFGTVAANILAAVVDFLGPAISGFRDLGRAIGDAFQGDFSGLLDGVRSVASGIVEVFTSLGVLIYDALAPQVERAVRFLSEAFDRIDFAAVGLKILEVVRLIGFTLGSIISDPVFIQAVEGIIAAAVAVGGSFILGFAEGVASNLPEVLDLLGGQLKTVVVEAIKFAFNDPLIIGQIILGALAASAVLNAFSAAGEAGAKGMFQGFTSGLRRSPVVARDLANGLFGGQGGINDAIAFNARRAAETLQRQLSRSLRDIGRLGGDTSNLFPDGIVRQSDVNRAKRELRNLEASIGQTQASARLFRVRLSEGFTGLRTGVREFGRAITPGLDGSFTRARAGFSQTFTAITDGLSRLREQGRISGAALGSAVLGAFGAVISGQQLGQASSGQGQLLGLSGILASAIGAGLATKSPIVGAAVGGLGLIAAAFAKAGEEARIAAEKVKGYVQGLSEVSIGKGIEFITRTLTERIREVDEGVARLFSGFDDKAFAASALAGNVDIDTVFRELATNAGLSAAAITQFQAKLDRSDGDLNAYKQGLIGIQSALSNTTDGTADFGRLLEDLNIDDNDLFKALRLIFDESEAVAKALSRLEIEATFSSNQPDLAAQGIAKFNQQLEDSRSNAVKLGEVRPFEGLTEDGEDTDSIMSSVLSTIIELGLGAESLLDIDVGAFFDQFGRFDLRGFITQLTRQSDAVDVLGNGFTNAGGALNAFTTAARAGLDALREAAGIIPPLSEETQEFALNIDLVSEAINELNRRRTDRIQQQINAVQTRLDAAQEAANQAREALTAFITGRYADTASAQVDNLIGNIGSIGSSIEEALQQGGVRGEAALRSAVGGFENQLASIIQAGFDDGLRSQEEFRALLAPLAAALNEEVGDSASRILSTVDFDFGINRAAGDRLQATLQNVLSDRQVEIGARTLLNANAEVARIQRELDAYKADLDVEVRFDANQIQTALLEAGLNAQILQLLDLSPENIAALQQQGLAGTVAQQNNALAQFQGGAPIIPVTQPQSASGPTVYDYSQTTIEVTETQSALATGKEVQLAKAAAAAGRLSQYRVLPV